MGIREAKPDDGMAISELLVQLGYPGTEPFIKEKIEQLEKHPDEVMLVYEIEGKVVAFVSLHFIPQIALQGDFARISYLIVDKAYRNRGIGGEIENYCFKLAKNKNCDRMEVQSHAKRRMSHRFYYRQGYEESPKYFIKMIDNT
ncbi:MAG: GNAT family N-acetyltransferase [Clostridiaceae bacterium]